MRGSIAAFGVAIVAVACCAAGPLVMATVGGLSVGALLGWGAALIALVAGLAILLARRAWRGQSRSDR